MSYDKQGYNRIFIGLVGMILALIIFIIVRPTKTKTIEITKEVEVPKEVIVEVEKEVIVEVEKEVIVEVEKEPTYVYNITSSEREMLARIVHLESNIESVECQTMVASVIINRWKNGHWGDTLQDVIYADKQFSPSGSIWKTTPTDTNYEAVDYVLRYGCTLPEYVLYFRASYHFNWKGYCPYLEMDNTYFGYLEKDKQ